MFLGRCLSYSHRRHGCRLSCKQPWMADFATVAKAEILFSEPLEQLASYNGADMHKYNMLYTIKFIEHVLTHESYYIKRLSHQRLNLKKFIADVGSLFNTYYSSVSIVHVKDTSPDASGLCHWLLRSRHKSLGGIHVYDYLIARIYISRKNKLC